MLIVKHEADALDNRREADVLGAGQVVQNNLGLGFGSHVMQHREVSIDEVQCNCRVSNMKIYQRRFSVEARLKD
jgi:hypothetical protein